MKYRVRHLTKYQYNSPVTLCYNMTHLLPRNTASQHCVQRRITVTPMPVYQNEGYDYFGNLTFYFSIQVPHDTLTIEMESELDIDEINRADLLHSHSLTCGEYRQQLHESVTPELRMAKEYLLDSSLIRRSERLACYAADIFHDDAPVIQAAAALTHRIFEEFTFDPIATSVSTRQSRSYRKSGGLSGFCPSGDRLPAFRRLTRALYQRLYRNATARGAGKISRDRCVACVVCHFYPRRRLAGV
jgi:transglutaminase-like putative cysteine protease